MKEDLPHPIEAIKFRMEQMGWNATELAKRTGFPLSHVSEFLSLKRRIPLSFIRAYHHIADATPLEILIQDYSIEKEWCGSCGHDEAWHFEEEAPSICQVHAEVAAADCECKGFQNLP